MNKKQWLTACNRMLSGALALLGFTSCSELIQNEEPCMYGQPYADYKIKGKVQDEQAQPLQGMRVIIKPLQSDGTPFPYYADTLKTDSEGAYEHQCIEFGKDYRVVCEDPADAYKADSTDVQMNPTGGDGGWYIGSDTKEVDFILKEKEEEDDSKR